MIKVVSPTGEFPMSFEEVHVEGDALVLTGKMGIWKASTHIPAADMLALVPLMLKPAVLWFLLKLPFLALKAKFGKQM